MEEFPQCLDNRAKQSLVGNLVKELNTNARIKKIKLIWLEVTGCSGNIISFLNALNPDVNEMLNNNIDLCFSNSLMVKENKSALQQLYDTAEEEFILAIDGAVASKNPLYNIIGRYNGKEISALEAVKYFGEKAAHVIAVGTCASYGGISAARPNPANCQSVSDVLSRQVIRTPGCPCHPDWLIGTLAYILLYGKAPELDSEGRPILFYGITIHDNCTRRSFFDKGIFAEKLGEKTCMFKLGCDGPRTKSDCPTRQWNGYINWPIGANTPCIGCAHSTFPDGTEPFVKFSGGEVN